MKRLGFIIIMLLCMAVNMQAQDIVGKWKCRKGDLEQMGSHYKYLKGHCRFKDDGTFEVKLNSTREVSPEYTVYIKVMGTYTIDGGVLTTHVDRDGVYCNAPNDTPNAYMEPQKQKNEGYYRAENWGERKYDVASGRKDMQEDSREAELLREWNWTNEKVTLSGKTLTIDGKARLKR